MFGTWVNFFAILIGSLIGLFLHRGISTKITSTLMKGLGLVIVLLGIEGSIQVTNWTMLIVCIAVGSFLGEWIDIEARLEKFGLFVESRVAKNAKGTFATGFVTASLLFGVGAMAIQGALNDGLFHDSTTLITKSLLDFIGSIVFASTMGIGVMFSAFVILFYQGSITLLSSFARPLLSDLIIFDMGIVGSVIIIGLGLKMMKISDIKVANLIPAMFLPIVFHPLFDFIATLWSRI